MSIKKLYSNELLASFEYSNIDKDYDFYYVITSDKYIKGGAAFLDIDDIKISALQFESGKSFWVMLPKNAISRAEFVRLLNAKEDGDSLSIKSMTSSSIPEYLLTQLFLNALTSPVDEMISFNNLSGKLLCFRPSWLNKDKENFIWGMQCLEVKVGDDMCVNLVAHRMTSLALKKQMKFEKRKLQDYPQYEFSYNNNTLKRVSNENKDRRENFIIKPVDGERGSITFFDFTDYETFSCTKMGVLYDILNALHDEFGKYIRVKFKQYSIDEVLEYKRASLELYKDIVKKEVLNSGINIVDAVHSETSEDYLQDVADGINKIIPEAKCSVGKRLSKKKLNVRYIHDKSFYSDSEVDPHQESMEDYVVQHITVENFKHQSSAAVYNILKELVIKKDIATGKITLVDWSQYGYKADWLFGVVVDGTYYFMTIHPDGSFKIEALKRNFFTMTEYDKYMDYFGLNEENKNDYRGVIGLVKDAEGNINLIKDTNMYSMPDYTAMGDVLKNVASEGRFPGKDVVTWLRLVMDTTDDIFAENAWYFRNALVRANYNDLKNGVHETTEYLELFLRNLLLDEKNELHNRTMHISGRFAEVDIERVKVDIESGEVDIESTKVDIRNKLLSFSDTISEKTINHTVEIFSKCGKENCFGRTIVEEITGLKPSGASKLIKLLVDSEVIVPVTGHGKGKYRFQ